APRPPRLRPWAAGGRSVPRSGVVLRVAGEPGGTGAPAAYGGAGAGAAAGSCAAGTCGAAPPGPGAAPPSVQGAGPAGAAGPGRPVSGSLPAGRRRRSEASTRWRRAPTAALGSTCGGSAAPPALEAGGVASRAAGRCLLEWGVRGRGRAPTWSAGAARTDGADAVDVRPASTSV